MKLKSSRRQFSRSVVAGGALVATGAVMSQSQNPQFSRIPARSAGSVHTGRLEQARERLGPSSPIAVDGLKKLVDELNALIPPAAAAALKRLIDALAAAANVQAMIAAAQRLLQEVTDAADDLAAAIGDIVKSSAEYVLQRLKEDNVQRALVVVFSDLAGGLTGAATGAKLGQYGAIVGCVIGASSASVNAAFAKR